MHDVKIQYVFFLRPSWYASSSDILAAKLNVAGADLDRLPEDGQNFPGILCSFFLLGKVREKILSVCLSVCLFVTVCLSVCTICLYTDYTDRLSVQAVCTVCLYSLYNLSVH